MSIAGRSTRLTTHLRQHSAPYYVLTVWISFVFISNQLPPQLYPFCYFLSVLLIAYHNPVFQNQKSINARLIPFSQMLKSMDLIRSNGLNTFINSGIVTASP